MHIRRQHARRQFQRVMHHAVNHNRTATCRPCQRVISDRTIHRINDRAVGKPDAFHTECTIGTGINRQLVCRIIHGQHDSIVRPRERNILPGNADHLDSIDPGITGIQDRILPISLAKYIPVAADTTCQRIITGTAIQPIVTGIPRQAIIPLTAEQPIVTGPAGYLVITG